MNILHAKDTHAKDKCKMSFTALHSVNWLAVDRIKLDQLIAMILYDCLSQRTTFACCYCWHL